MNQENIKSIIIVLFCLFFLQSIFVRGYGEPYPALILPSFKINEDKVNHDRNVIEKNIITVYFSDGTNKIVPYTRIFGKVLRPIAISINKKIFIHPGKYGKIKYGQEMKLPPDVLVWLQERTSKIFPERSFEKIVFSGDLLMRETVDSEFKIIDNLYKYEVSL